MRRPQPFGKYLLLDRISVGGMAEVYKAKSYGVEGFEKIIAIKRILPSMGEDREFVKMFIDEAKIAGQLSHANICQIFELGKIESAHFIAMEYIWGKDLLQIHNRFRKLSEPMPPAMACYIISRVCEGLHYAHKKKDALGRPLEIVHRDCSPQNVLISYEGEVKLIDFGIAKAASRSSRTNAGVLKGKFGYMSPEQVRGLPLDRRSDIFAIGTVLYETLTGKRLFLGESDFSTLERVRNADIPPPREICPSIPVRVEEICMKALRRDPKDRYQWCADMNADLRSYLGEQTSAFTNKNLASWIRRTFAAEHEREQALMEEYKSVGADNDSVDDGWGEVSSAEPVVQIGAAELRARSGSLGPIDPDSDDPEDAPTAIFGEASARELLGIKKRLEATGEHKIQPPPSANKASAEGKARTFDSPMTVRGLGLGNDSTRKPTEPEGPARGKPRMTQQGFSTNAPTERGKRMRVPDIPPQAADPELAGPKTMVTPAPTSTASWNPDTSLPGPGPTARATGAKTPTPALANTAPLPAQRAPVAPAGPPSGASWSGSNVPSGPVGSPGPGTAPFPRSEPAAFAASPTMRRDSVSPPPQADDGLPKTIVAPRPSYQDPNVGAPMAGAPEPMPAPSPNATPMPPQPAMVSEATLVSQPHSRVKDIAIGMMLTLGMVVIYLLGLKVFGNEEAAPPAQIPVTGTIAVSLEGVTEASLSVNGEAEEDIVNGRATVERPPGTYVVRVLPVGGPPCVEEVNLADSKVIAVTCKVGATLQLEGLANDLVVFVDDVEWSSVAARKPMPLSPKDAHEIVIRDEADRIVDSFTVTLDAGQALKRRIKRADVVPPSDPAPEGEAAPEVAPAPVPEPEPSPEPEPEPAFKIEPPFIPEVEPKKVESKRPEPVREEPKKRSEPKRVVDDDKDEKKDDKESKGRLIMFKPRGAKVIVDGRDTGRTVPIPPRKALELSPGVHRVTLETTQGTFSFPVTIEAGKTTPLSPKIPR